MPSSEYLKGGADVSMVYFAREKDVLNLAQLLLFEEFPIEYVQGLRTIARGLLEDHAHDEEFKKLVGKINDHLSKPENIQRPVLPF